MGTITLSSRRATSASVLCGRGEQAGGAGRSIVRRRLVEGLDVNEPDTIRWAAARAGADGDTLLAAAQAAEPATETRAALSDFESHACPGVPTVVVGSERFFGKDRVDWIVEACLRLGRDPA